MTSLDLKCPQTGVTFILSRLSGEVLLQQRDDGNGQPILYPNRWCFPGGAQEPGESYMQTVTREVMEEYGIVLKENDCRLLMIYNHDDVIADHVFLCAVPDDVQPVLREGRAMAWKKLEELRGLDLAWEQDKILPLLNN